MRDETSEATREGGPGVHSSEPGSYTGKPLKNQPIGGAPLHLLIGRCVCGAAPNHPVPAKRTKCKCLARVEVTNNGSSTKVSLVNAPWGFSNCDKTFLHKPLAAKSIGAEIHALKIRQQIADAAWTEHARREHQRQLALNERIVRAGGGK